MDSIVLGGGCFWCIEALYNQIEGVINVISGYSGGNFNNPSFEDIHKYNTGHAEVVKIDYDKNVISLEDIVKIYWHVHDPTTLNRQGYDIGPHYRSIILYEEYQLPTIKQSIKNVANNIWDKPITTELKLLSQFYPAEEYHQKYFEKNPENSYCQIIINPKLNKFRKSFKTYLKR